MLSLILDGVVDVSDGLTSLHQAINDASSGDDILFSASGTITLTSPLHTIAHNIAIEGGGCFIIDGAELRRAFDTLGAYVTFDSLPLRDASSGTGAAALQASGRNKATQNSA